MTAKHFLSIAIFLLATVAARADDADPVSRLCASGIEGSYVGTIGTLRNRTNLICTSEGRLVVIFAEDAADSSGFQSLAQASIEGEDLVLSTFPLKNEERRSISSKATMSYLKLKLADLEAGRLRGIFHGGNLERALVVHQDRAAKFPHWACDPAAAVPARAIQGTYRFQDPTLGEVSIYADVLSGTPVFTIVIPGQRGFQTMDGPPWDGSGCFESFTAQGDGEADSRALNFLRGHWQNGQLEISWINFHGSKGPLRSKSFVPTLVGKSLR